MFLAGILLRGPIACTWPPRPQGQRRFAV